MGRIVVGLLILAASVVMAAGSSGGQPRLRLTVEPAIGYPTTRFRVAFTAPRAAKYLAVATSSCGQRAASDVRATRKGERLRARLVANKPWCRGVVHGRVSQSDVTLARFSVRVVKLGTDTTPPAFAGLQSAFACTPGPQRPGETTPFTLTWKAATDNRTPSSEMVYDVFMSTTSGGENFSTPNWTTAPGVTTFKTPGLASHGRFYFVVRARDTAGNEDHNTVERRGVDPCL